MHTNIYMKNYYAKFQFFEIDNVKDAFNYLEAKKEKWRGNEYKFKKVSLKVLLSTLKQISPDVR